MNRWLAGILLLLGCTQYALCRDLGQWEKSDPETRAWFRNLKQPDTLVSCCGEGDGYWADEVNIDANGRVIATVTDDREDTPLGRGHVPMGTKYIVPPAKMVDARVQGGNPTGHAIVFLSAVSWEANTQHPEQRAVLCYVAGWGL